MQIKQNNIIVGSLVAITALSTAILTLPSALADDGFVDIVTVTVPVSCSLGASGMDTHTASIQNGVTTENIGTTNIKVTCNDSAGYALYAIGYTNNEYGNNKLTSTTLGSTHDIITSTTITSGTSSWAMKLTKGGSNYLPIIAGSTDDTNKQTGDPDFSGYTAVPDEYTKVAYALSSTDMGANASGSNLTTTYRAYISQTQPAGTYIGQVKYTLVHPNTAGKPVAPLKDSDCPAGNVCYAPNANDIVGSMDSISSNKIASSPTAGKQYVGTSANTINLIAPNYKREGYGFAGWSTDFTATNASTIYGPNETITTADLLANENITFSSQGLILYPVWVASAGNLQGWTGCSDPNLIQATYDSENNKMVATLSSVTALTDTRDDNVYAVAKLADGKCWMIENLRLDNTADFDPTKSQGFGGTFSALPASTDSWSTSDIVLPQLNTNNTNIGGKNASDTDLTPSYDANYTTTAQWYSYGNYYSWAAAIADTRAYDSLYGHTTVETSLCPAGWHLPYGNSGNSSPNLGNTAGGFYYLNAQMANDTSDQGSKDLRSFPNNFIYSGDWNGAVAFNRNSYGSYWSSSAINSGLAYYLTFGSSSVYPGTYNGNKHYGRSIRCIAGS